MELRTSLLIGRVGAAGRVGGVRSGAFVEQSGAVRHTRRMMRQIRRMTASTAAHAFLALGTLPRDRW